MALFRPYQHDSRRKDGDDATTPSLVPEPAPKDRGTGPAVSDPATDVERASGRAAKARPTPSRREAEAARRERLNPSISKKEARRRAAAANRGTRLAQMAARDNTPAKELLRDHIDARFNLGQLLLPGLLVIVASTFLGPLVPNVVLVSTVGMYVFLALVIGDFVLTWRRFTRLAAERGVPLEKGLRMYGMNRMIQIRRMRIPKPRVKRGDAY